MRSVRFARSSWDRVFFAWRKSISLEMDSMFSVMASTKSGQPSESMRRASLSALAFSARRLANTRSSPSRTLGEGLRKILLMDTVHPHAVLRRLLREPLDFLLLLDAGDAGLLGFLGLLRLGQGFLLFHLEHGLFL